MNKTGESKVDFPSAVRPIERLKSATGAAELQEESFTKPS